MRLMTGGVSFEQRQEAEEPSNARFKTRKFVASRPRILAFCLGPAVPGVLLVLSALSYYHSIPPGDQATRHLAVGLCSVVAGVLFGGATFLYMSYAQKNIGLEATRIVILDGESLLTSSWSEVVLEPVKGGWVKTFVFFVAGRRKSIDSVFFPDFGSIVAMMNERVASANRALTESTHVL
jgi:hypothetical protein